MSQLDILERSATVESVGARLVGRSAAADVIEQAIARAAASDSHVLITGEAGVGKHAVARRIHQQSRRAIGPMLTLNCHSLPELLLESELFGHVRGAFTGAYRDKRGLLEAANGGTLFLDDVDALSWRMQVGLLRFVESGEIQRVGSDAVEVRANARLITGAPKNLQLDAVTGTISGDLSAHLQAIKFELPPLRERAGDIPRLVEDMLQSYADTHGVPKCDISPEALELLSAYRWPGNICQLELVVERLALIARASTINLGDLPSEILRSN